MENTISIKEVMEVVKAINIANEVLNKTENKPKDKYYTGLDIWKR